MGWVWIRWLRWVLPLGLAVPLILASASAAASARSAPPASTYFPKSCTTPDQSLSSIGTCARHQLTRADAQLKTALKNEDAVMASSKVRSDESKWNHLVAVECAYESDAYKDLTRSVDKVSCQLSLTQVRVGEVRQLVTQGRYATAGPAPTSDTSSAGIATSTAGAGVTLALVVCPTENAITEPSAPTPPHIRVVKVPASLANELAVYTDDLDRIEVVAPLHWDCRALFGADGSGQVEVTPTTGAGQQAINATETGGCAGCAVTQACPLFAAAAYADAHDGYPACRSKPSEETTAPLSATVISLTDPAGVSGNADPSGGPYAAHAVMTYVNGSDDGSWEDTCDLPPTFSAVCAASLDQFAAEYGDD